MSILDGTTFIERLQFFNGQRLAAVDLQGIEAFNREMRWLHNTSLHQPGIGCGFVVGGSKGDRSITIGPGYAIDLLGREIVLTQAVVEPIPPTADDGAGNPVFYDLTVAYPDDSELQTAETQEGICLPRGVVRLSEAPVFCWVKLEMTEVGLFPGDKKLADDIQSHRRIILAQIEVLNCELNQPSSIAQRLDARPNFGPYLASGTEPIVLTNLIAAGPFFGISSLRYTATIDTTSSKFRTIPSYSAHFEGPRIPADSTPSFVFIDSLHIQQPGIQNFKVDSLILILALNVSNQLIVSTPPDLDPIKKRIQTDWNLVWMGVEG